MGNVAPMMRRTRYACAFSPFRVTSCHVTSHLVFGLLRCLWSVWSVKLLTFSGVLVRLLDAPQGLDNSIHTYSSHFTFSHLFKWSDGAIRPDCTL